MVAEQFGMLEALFPGRIDLGVGRSLGFTAPVRRALRADDTDTFAEDLTELLGYLDGRAPVTARPRLERPPPVFVLATGAGLELAGNAGLPVVLGGPVLWDSSLGDRLSDYRARAGSSAYLMVSLDVLVADSVPAARELALAEAWALAEARTVGAFPALAPPDGSRVLTERQRSVVESALDRTILGDEAEVAERLEELFERTGADELLASTSTYGLAELAESDARLAALFGRS